MTRKKERDDPEDCARTGIRPEVRAKVMESLDLDPLAYVKGLSMACKDGELPRNVRPSLIQREQKRRRLLRSSLLLGPPGMKGAEVRECKGKDVRC